MQQKWHTTAGSRFARACGFGEQTESRCVDAAQTSPSRTKLLCRPPRSFAHRILHGWDDEAARSQTKINDDGRYVVIAIAHRQPFHLSRGRRIPRLPRNRLRRLYERSGSSWPFNQSSGVSPHPLAAVDSGPAINTRTPIPRGPRRRVASCPATGCGRRFIESGALSPHYNCGARVV